MLCLVVAGLAGAARAQTTYLTATLTADQRSIYFGCDNSDASQDHCSSSSVLTEDGFTYGGTTFTVAAFLWRSDTDELILGISGETGATSKRKLGGLTLEVDGTAFAISEATVVTNTLEWSYDPATDWEDGTTVSVKIIQPRILLTATLTVDEDDQFHGCNNFVSSTDACSSSTVLTDDDFTYEGNDYSVSALTWNSNTNELDLGIHGEAGLTIKRKLGALTLEIDGIAFAISEGSTGLTTVIWKYDPATDWEDGTTVAVKIILPKPKVALVLAASTIAESGAGNSTTLKATISRSATSAVSVTVGAAPTGKVQFGGTTLTIPANMTESSAVTVTAVDDNVDAPHASVSISGSVSGTDVDPPDDVTLTVTDDEPKPKVALRLAALTIAESGANNSTTLKATMPHAVTSAVAVTVSAAPAGKVRFSGTTLTIPANMTESPAVTVTAVDNNVDAPHASVRLSGSLSGTAADPPDVVTLTVTDDEGPPTVALVLGASAIDESGANNSTTLKATLTRATSSQVVVTVSAAPVGKVEFSGTTLTIPGNSTSSAEVTVTALDNDVDAPDASVVISGSVSSAAVEAPANATLTVTDDDRTQDEEPQDGEAPGAPAAPRVTGFESRLYVVWSPPADEGTHPVTGYDLAYRPTDASEWTVLRLAAGADYAAGSGGIRHRIEGLDNGTRYEVRVRAVSSAGAGPWSETASGTPAALWLAPYWQGAGGFVVRPADGRSAVVQLRCGGRQRRSIEYAGADGLIVRAVEDCVSDDGRPLPGDLTFEGIGDGGWYWLNGDRNVAVAPLVVEASLNGELRPPVPGGVTASPAGDHRFVREVTGRLYGTLMVHEGNGLMGIVPHLAEMEGDGAHLAPYWRGGGGIVGRPLDGESAEVRLSCEDGGSETYSLAPGEDGVIAALLPGGCFGTGGNPIPGGLEADGLEDGAWYWINGHVPAAAPLVRRDSEPAALTVPLVPEGVEADAGPRGTLFVRRNLMGVIPRLRPTPP